MTGHAVGHDEAIIARLRDEVAWLRSVVEMLITGRNPLEPGSGQARPGPGLAGPAVPSTDRRARRLDSTRAVTQTRPLLKPDGPPDGTRRTAVIDGTTP